MPRMGVVKSAVGGVSEKRARCRKLFYSAAKKHTSQTTRSWEEFNKKFLVSLAAEMVYVLASDWTGFTHPGVLWGFVLRTS
jgi:hypothetical protein